jgi:serine/threonine-protein kinase
VYLARDVQLGRLVAIKFLLKPDHDAEIRIQREAQILASLRHPGICSIFDIGSDPTRGIYLVLELLEGETLRETLFAGAVGLERTACGA